MTTRCIEDLLHAYLHHTDRIAQVLPLTAVSMGEDVTGPTGFWLPMNESVQNKIATCTSIPTLPVVAAKLIDTVNQDDFGINDIATVVEQDLGISAKLIKTANSSAFRRGAPSTDVLHAASRLGTKAAVMTALSFSLAAPLKSSNAKGIDADYLWKRSIVSAVTARLLATTLRTRNAEACFLAGLVQDLGVWVLAATYADLYDGLPSGTHEAAVKAEVAALDCDHATVGHWMLEQWQFPQLISTMVQSSHDFAALTTGIVGHTEQWCVAASGVVADSLLSGDELAIARTISLIENTVADQTGLPKPDLSAPLSDTIRDAESLFDAALVSDPLALMESSKALLFEHTMSHAVDSSPKRLNELEDRIAVLEGENQIDALTGLYNRSHFEHELAHQVAAARENGQPLSLAFIDADHFKAINDNHGHVVGDDVLKSMAKTLKSLVRGSDTIARYGGEEFVLILPDMGSLDAGSLAERICDRIRNSPVPAHGFEIAVTVSVGIASFGGDIQTEQDLLIAADQAMYFAKQRGRDVCVSASELPAVRQTA